MTMADDDPTACAVWEAPPTTLRAAIAVLWPVRYPTASAAKKAARQGEAWLNGQRCKGRRSSTQQVQPGDTVGFQQLPPRRQREIAPTQRAPTLVVAYLDPTLAVVVKPAGMSVMGGKKSEQTSNVLTMHRLLFHKLPPSAAVQPLQRPSPVHRLDKLTSGLLAVARTVPCARDITTALASRQVTKRYRAVVHGELGLVGQSGEVTAQLDGKDCRSEWRVVERLNRNLTLLDLFPHTGRVHQLRRHCQKLGHPIVGDPQYGSERDDAALSADQTESLSLMLAAVDLKLSHPEAQYAARITDQDDSESWAFAAADQSSCTFDPADGALRVQIEMPPAMRRLVEAVRVSATSTSETLLREECVSQP
jgi:RluA family pseudouridine synthase